MAKTKEELVFVVECTADDDEKKTRRVSVYKSGGSFILRSEGDSTVCHPSVHTNNDIKREIALVYNVMVTGIKYPGER